MLGSGCGWQGRRGPSTLVIAVEGLAFESVTCESEDFRSFCEEGVRFTHAFTTSTLSQPALASLVTGLYPIEHGVRHNGRDFLSPRFMTVGEAAINSGMRTALFSGGAPILRKSGLSQGFETFDDNIPIGLNRYYRPAADVVQAFVNWHLREAEKTSFFATLYLADLQFPEAQTTSDLGEVRDRSADAQMKEVAESLNGLIRYLKSKGLWHRIHVVLVGLNGLKSTHTTEIKPLNIFADNTQVSLFLKPARRSQDLGPQWTIDKNVTLADVGASLFEFVGGRAPEPPMPQLDRVSLYKLIDQAHADWDDDRLILIESAWGEWRRVSNIRFATRRRQYLYVHDAQPKIYNTLLDRLESTPLPARDPLWTALKPTMISFFEEHQISPWTISDDQTWNHILMAKQWWKGGGFGEGVGGEPSILGGSQSRRWRAERAVVQEDWSALQEIGESAKDALMTYVARQNLSLPTRRPGGRCARLFHSSTKPNFRIDTGCDDEMLIRLVEWANGDDEDRRGRALESFILHYRAHKLETAIGAANYARLLPWDASPSAPRGLTLSDLFLALPNHRPLAGTIRSRISRENKALDL